MRNPVNDPNAGAQQDAPAIQHAARAVTIANNHNNQMANRAQQINKISSKLGNALGNFMEEKRDNELEERYNEAFYNQGAKEGMAEYQKDLKRTGFTKFIYGGQAPEYQGALDAATTNAANSMYLDQREFIEGAGADLTPDQYREHSKAAIKEYVDGNFGGSPDAIQSFMKSWKNNSNELARQQVKNFRVREQQKARKTVADGIQVRMDTIKGLMDSNPDKADEEIEAMLAGGFVPEGMDKEAATEVFIDEMLTAGRAHDFLGVELLNRSGLTKNFTDKQWKAYDTVRGIIDTDNFNMLEAARLEYEEVVENPNSSSEDVQVARAAYRTSLNTTAARNTGTSKHLKTVFGADRHRTVLGNQYTKAVDDERKKKTAEQVTLFKDVIFKNALTEMEKAKGDSVTMQATASAVQSQLADLLPVLPPKEYQALLAESNLQLAKYGVKINAQSEAERKAVSQGLVDTAVLQDDEAWDDINSTSPEGKRNKLADYMDNLDQQLANQQLDPEARMKIQDLKTKASAKMSQWESAAAAQARKDAEAQAKKDLEAQQLKMGVDSLITGGGYVPQDGEQKKRHLNAAVESVADQVLPDPDMPATDKLEQIMSNPLQLSKFLRSAGNFQTELGDSQGIKTAITNLGMVLQAPNEANVYNQRQVAAVQALDMLQRKAPALYNATFASVEDRRKMEFIRARVKSGADIATTNQMLNNLDRNIDIKTADKMNGEDLIGALNLAGAPAYIQDRAYTEYRALLSLGHDAALRGAQKYMQDVDVNVGGTYVKYGGTFGKVADKSLKDVMNIMNKTIRTGGITKSGWTEPLSRLLKNDRTKSGQELYKLSQVPGIQVSVYNGTIVLEYNGRVAPVSRDAIELEINEYGNRIQSEGSTRRWGTWNY